MTALMGVKKTIAIASGKGGVGKSSTAFSLALTLSNMGYNIGLCDLDVFGPSLPSLLNHNSQPKVVPPKKFIPIHKNGLKCMSMGFFIKSAEAVVWRGLMVQSATKQLLNDVIWGHDGVAVDVLIIDLPPGTGDTPITMVKNIHLDAAIIVTTPQRLALDDAGRAIDMFHKVNVPVLGIIENMATITCNHCHQQHYLYSRQGFEHFLQDQKLKIIGSLPFDQAYEENLSQGKPHVLENPDTDISQKFHIIAENIMDKLGETDDNKSMG